MVVFRVIACPRAGAEKPSYADMAALADGAAEVPIVSPLSGAVLDAVAAAEGWQERARRAMAKRNSGQKLSKCLTWLASSIERALEQLTMRVAVRPDAIFLLTYLVIHITLDVVR